MGGLNEKKLINLCLLIIRKLIIREHRIPVKRSGPACSHSGPEDLYFHSSVPVKERVRCCVHSHFHTFFNMAVF